MDTTIRNLEEEAYRQLKAKAALEGKTIGEALNEAIRAWLAASQPTRHTGSLRDLRPRSWGAGNERASEQVDRIVYGARS